MSVILILLQLFSFRIIPGPPRLAIALYLQCQDTPHVLWIPLPIRFSIFFFTPFGITGRVCKYVKFTYLMPNNNSKLLFFSTACYSESLWLQKFWNENFKNISNLLTAVQQTQPPEQLVMKMCSPRRHYDQVHFHFSYHLEFYPSGSAVAPNVISFKNALSKDHVSHWMDKNQ